MQKYKYNKMAGALQEASPGIPAIQEQASSNIAPPMRRLAVPNNMPVQQQSNELNESEITGVHFAESMLQAPSRTRGAVESRRAEVGSTGLDPQTMVRRTTMFFYIVEEGQRVLMIESDGQVQEVVGPKKVWSWGRKFRTMGHWVAHPGEFLVVRFRDGSQEHLIGPDDVWLDPRKHVSVTKEEALQIASKEAVVVYSTDEEDEVSRRIVHGPAMFVPKPGEWLHTFSWHGSKMVGDSVRKIPNAMVFQKLWLMPDQMYHDVTNVRTANDAVLTVHLMIFFELIDIEKMLETSHDPIGDFVNAATSDIVEFISKFDFETFKQNTGNLNDLSSYKQITSRGEQCGYRINKVVYRGYSAPKSLQDMHNQAIESRTRLQLERQTERQAQELEDYKLERNLSRSERKRTESAAELQSSLEHQRKRHQVAMQEQSDQRKAQREQQRADQLENLEQQVKHYDALRDHLEQLKTLGVDLTAYLTQERADQVIELRSAGKAPPHIHMDLPKRLPKG
jgi:hypothetical protein